MNKKITRKEAIKKAGVTALAATSLVFLKTNASAKKSCPYPPHGPECLGPPGHYDD